MPDNVTIQPTGIYSSDDVSAMLDVGGETLAKARRTGALRAVRKGRRWIYLGEWLLDWLRHSEEVSQAHRQGGPTHAA
jgi:hypothetical protein